MPLHRDRDPARSCARAGDYPGLRRREADLFSQFSMAALNACRSRKLHPSWTVSASIRRFASSPRPFRA